MQMVTENIKIDLSQVKEDNKRLKDKLVNKDEQIKQHQFLLNEHEQYSRRNNIRINCLEDTNKDESLMETCQRKIKA